MSSQDMAWEPKLTLTNSQMTEEALPSVLLAWLLGSTSKMSSSLWLLQVLLQVLPWQEARTGCAHLSLRPAS